jgi:hypothetical protein
VLPELSGRRPEVVPSSLVEPVGEPPSLSLELSEVEPAAVAGPTVDSPPSVLEPLLSSVVPVGAADVEPWLVVSVSMPPVAPLLPSSPPVALGPPQPHAATSINIHVLRVLPIIPTLRHPKARLIRNKSGA